jgi:hypothetical protein
MTHGEKIQGVQHTGVPEKTENNIKIFPHLMETINSQI